MKQSMMTYMAMMTGMTSKQLQEYFERMGDEREKRRQSELRDMVAAIGGDID